MPVTATYVDMDRFQEELTQTPSGMQGTRYFKVNTRVRELAFQAGGLPAFGEKWSSLLPDLRAVKYENPVLVGGKVSPDLTGGFCFVPVTYTTDPLPGDSWSEVGGSIETFQRYYHIGAAINTPPIANGDGTACETGTTNIIVTSIYRPDEGEGLSALFSRLVLLKRLQAVNDGAIRMPPLRFTNIGLDAAAGEARFHDYEIEPERGQVVVRIVLKMAPDHLFRWSPANADGSLNVSQPRTSQVYEATSFSGLWP